MYALLVKERIICVNEDYRFVEEERQSLISYGDYNDDEISIVEVEYYDTDYSVTDTEVNFLLADIVYHLTNGDIDLEHCIYDCVTEEAERELAEWLNAVLNLWLKKHDLDKQIYTTKEDE